MQSSFEDNLVTQEMVDSREEKSENLGKYKVEYKSIGKNNFNPNEVEFNSLISKNEDVYILPENSVTRWIISSVIKLKPNTTYTININSSSNEARFSIMDDSIYGGADGEWAKYRLSKSSHNATNIVQFTTNEKGTASIYICTDNDYIRNRPQITYKFQIEEGSSATEYEPYKESINTFYLNSPLLKGDTIEIINGQATHVHRYKKIVLDGSEEDWKDWNTEVNIETTRFRIITYDGRSNGIALSDKFRTRKAPSEIHSDTEYIGLIGSNSTLFINILSSKLSSADIDGFKQWLSENPVTVVYELENPIYEPIKADLSVQLFEGTVHISNNSNIPANMEVTVDRTINRAVEAIELAKTNSTVSNISSARMWTNLLKETIKKDELQNEINDIVDIEDLQLERKTVASNIDVYIKSENMLLMSLSTNSITFNDFSGVEDMELNNAINISINSSLPYQLNSYLLTEIENSDKSNRIEKDLLNIKTNDDADYKTFNNINEKLILEDGCIAGNNKSHSIDFKLKGSQAHKADIYKTVIKFEAEQK